MKCAKLSQFLTLVICGVALSCSQQTEDRHKGSKSGQSEGSFQASYSQVWECADLFRRKAELLAERQRIARLRVEAKVRAVEQGTDLHEENLELETEDHRVSQELDYLDRRIDQLGCRSP
jgi:hypothetical protein